MGPSGAGKTTLLNILAGQIDKSYEGEVHVNGYLRDRQLFNMQSCYVMQDDCLLQELTVREALSMSIKLRTPAQPGGKWLRHVDDTLSQWGLKECEDTLTRCLSGGEKKRLAIAQELISNAPVLFLDEPTSGLDSGTALRCVRVLKSLAASGHTVLCSIHNPSSMLFSYFDKVYMLSSGQCIYNGSVDHLIPFLASQDLHCPIYTSPSDYITEIASGEHGNLTQQLAILFIPDESASHLGNKNTHLSQVTAYGGHRMSDKLRKEQMRQYEVKVKPHQQFKILLQRCFLCVIRNKASSLCRILVNIFFAGLLTSMYHGSGNRAGQTQDTSAMFLLAISMMLFQSVGPTVLTFPSDISVVLREQRNCWYSPGVYYAAKLITDFPFVIGGPFLMMAILHWSTSQPMEFHRYATVIVFSILVSSASQSIGYVLSAAFSLQTAVYVAVPMTTPWFIFSGHFVQAQYASAAIKSLTYFSHVYYGHRAIMFAVYGRGRGQLECGDSEPACIPIDGDDVLEMMEARDLDLLEYAGKIVAIDLSLKVVSFGLLKWRLWRKY
ncbi:ATP-binding cassette sub-family G member 1-like isoform X1 [Haemaphysalis longicornis]